VSPSGRVPPSGLHVAYIRKPSSYHPPRFPGKGRLPCLAWLHCNLPLLPALIPTNQGRLPNTFAETLVDGLTNIAVKMHINRRAHETCVSESTRTKTFWEKCGDRTGDGIPLFTVSSNDDIIPPFYQELGGKQKGESERVILQREVEYPCLQGIANPSHFTQDF
jgi:hypothetical protein